MMKKPARRARKKSGQADPCIHGELKLFAGNSNPDLAKKIAKPLIRKLRIQPESIHGHEEEFLEKIVRIYGNLTG